MVTTLARDWTLDQVRDEASRIWETYRRERIDLGEQPAQETRIKALRKLIEEATEDGTLTVEEVRAVLKEVAASSLTSTRHA